MKNLIKFVKHNPLFFGPFVVFIFMIVIGIVVDLLVVSLFGAIFLTVLMVLSIKTANGKLK